MMTTKAMQNTHIEHPEDTILTGDLSVLDWFCDRHDVNATDEVIDFVVDAHFAFHGE